MRPTTAIVGTLLALAALTLPAAAQPRAPVANTLTYQGLLKDAGLPANGSYDLQFRLFDDAVAGLQQGPTVCSENVVVTDGLFTVTLNFGDVYANTALWLAIGARADATPGNCGGGVYTAIDPRQAVTLTPFAAYSLDADLLDGQSAAFFQNASNLNAGTISDARLSANVALLNTAQTFTAVKSFSNDVNMTSDDASLIFPATDGINSPMMFMFASGTVNGDRMVIAHGPANPGWGLRYDDSGDQFHFTSGAVEKLTIGLSQGDLTFSDDSGSITFPVADATNSPMIHMFASGIGNGTRAVIAHSPTFADWGLAYNDGTDDFDFIADGASRVKIDLDGSSGAWLVVDGTARVDVLEIVGADVAEKFPISDTPKAVQPGHVVAIDPRNPGQLCLARDAYSSRVAGIVSGANGLPAGTILGNLPGHEDSIPIALTGRVWCWCDATTAPIAPGDLLTTSDTPGHAMKSADRDRSHGAVLGKAMTELREGRGMVLVLVNLQ